MDELTYEPIKSQTTEADVARGIYNCGGRVRRAWLHASLGDDYEDITSVMEKHGLLVSEPLFTTRNCGEFFLGIRDREYVLTQEGIDLARR